MYRTLGLVLAVSLTPLIACNDGETDTDVECDVSATLYPAADDTRAYYRSDITATFAPSIPAGATITVTGPDGEVAGTTEESGRRLTFTPSSPLTPGGEYTTTATYDCNGATLAPSATWTVSQVGTPVLLDDLTGMAYALDLANANFVEPEGIGAVLGSFLDFELLVGVDAVDEAATTITMVGALGVEGQPGVQEPCTPSIPFPEADISENPYFEVGPQVFTIEISGTEVTIDDLFLAGAFAPDGEAIDGVVLSGVIDTRPFAGLIDESEDPPEDAVCVFAFDLGIECEACPDGSGDFCLSLLANRITADPIDNEIELIDDPCLKDECSAEPECLEE